VARPQVENGFTRVANELLDALCRLHLPGNQWKVLHVIIRKTYGWNQVSDWISGSQITEMTGLHRSRVCEALKALQQRRIILRDGRRVGIRKDYDAWLDVTQIRDNEPVQNVTQNRAPVTQNRDRMLRKSRHTKDKRHYTKDRDTNPPEKHPAVALYDELTGKRTRQGTLRYSRIAEIVGGDRRKLQFWREVVEGWLLSDYKPTNVRGMLDWFQQGKVGPRTTSAQIGNQQAEDQMERALELDRRKHAHEQKSTDH